MVSIEHLGNLGITIGGLAKCPPPKKANEAGLLEDFIHLTLPGLHRVVAVQTKSYPDFDLVSDAKKNAKHEMRGWLVKV